MSISTRKVVYVLGAGFSYGTEHAVDWGRSQLTMPLQYDLLEKIFQYKYRTTRDLDKLAKLIRTYFCPSDYRPSRRGGALRHEDLNNLSVEEIVTFLEEMARDSSTLEAATVFRDAESQIRQLTLELVEYLSTNGSPNKNEILKEFRALILDTDTIITFNWDTLLDRVLMNNRSRRWHPSWGYGRAVRRIFKYGSRDEYKIPNKHAVLLKLHGSINWLANGNNKTIPRGFSSRGKYDDVVMMPPKMLKNEIWGEKPTALKTRPPKSNWAVHRDRLYPNLWQEAEDALARAKRIVFIGYSFPAADTSVYGLIRRSLASSKSKFGEFPSVHIVDPNAANLSARFNQSFKIEIPIKNQFLSLSSYVLRRERGAL